MPDLTPDNRDVATVERVVPAPPEAIFTLLADPSRHREIDGSGTVREATEGSKRLALGDVFGMSMKMGFGYRMANTVVELEENRRIAWQPRPTAKWMRALAGGRIWRYELEPVEGGTKVREQWDITQEAHPFMVRPMRKKTVENMEKTLARIEDVVTAKS
jgi:hypothetical protein